MENYSRAVKKAWKYLQYRFFRLVFFFSYNFSLRKSLLNFQKKTYWAASASSSGTMLFLLTEPRRAIFGETAGAVIRSSVKVNYCQNIDNFIYCMTKPITKVAFQFWYQYHNYFLPKPSVLYQNLCFFLFLSKLKKKQA